MFFPPFTDAARVEDAHSGRIGFYMVMRLPRTCVFICFRFSCGITFELLLENALGLICYLFRSRKKISRIPHYIDSAPRWLIIEQHLLARGRFAGTLHLLAPSFWSLKHSIQSLLWLTAPPPTSGLATEKVQTIPRVRNKKMVQTIRRESPK